MATKRFWLRRAVCAAACLSMLSAASADEFGSGANQFMIDFVTISGATNPTSGYGIVNNDYRMGIYEITNDQWAKFEASLGVPVTGDPSSAYDKPADKFTGTNVPTNNVSWYEAAQFVNWLNTSTDHQEAYKFTGTQGQSDYALGTWSAAEADGTNLYRHKDAFYYLPTEDEWVKAGYWNGTSLQTYATKAGETLHQGDGVSGTGWNYYDGGYATDPSGPWDAGNGSEELNGTYDMMGNVWEWMESPYASGDYGTGSDRALHGGSYDGSGYLAALPRVSGSPENEYFDNVGFRVASEVPEPASLSSLAIGGLALIRRRRV
ncbi:MAG: SUMF1/EgtB/PvdO family nonheme iron enzyme [Phycisphaerae bacterium]